MNTRPQCVALLAVLLAACEPNPQRAEPTSPTPSATSSAADPEPATSSSAEPSTTSASDDAGAAPDAGATQTLFVHEAKVECEGGAGPMACLQVRGSESEPWRRFYGRIEGFTYDEGFTYELRVRAKDVPRPPADAPSRRLELVEIVSKKKPSAGH